MDNLWQQAQEAVKTGDNTQAQLLLANLLKQDRKNAEAWYLLSTITASKEHKEVFLGKVLKLNPNHPEAKAQLFKLQAPPPPVTKTAPPPMAQPTVVETSTAVAMPISSYAGDFEAQARGDTMPAWLATAGGTVIEAPVVTSAPSATTPPSVAQPVDVPDWLRDMPDKGWQEAQRKEEYPKKITPPTPKPPVPAIKPAPFSPILIGLILTALVVFVVMLYLVYTLFLA